MYIYSRISNKGHSNTPSNIDLGHNSSNLQLSFIYLPPIVSSITITLTQSSVILHMKSQYINVHYQISVNDMDALPLAVQLRVTCSIIKHTTTISD